MKKIILITCIVMAVMIIPSIPVFADDTVDENLNVGYTPDGVEIPTLPEEVYGKNYILLNRMTALDSTSTSGARTLYLFILPDDVSVKAENLDSTGNVYNETGNQVIRIYMPAGTTLSMYYYNLSEGWSEPEVITWSSATYTPSAMFIVKSTVDIMHATISDLIYFPRNTNVIEKPIIDPGTDPDIPATEFTFIQKPETTADRIYNLLLLDSIAAFAYIGYRTMKRIFSRMRTFREFRKGDK